MKNLITALCLFCVLGLNAQVKKTDIEAAIAAFPDLLTKTGSKITIFSANSNIQCVAASTKMEAKETALYLYEYFDAKKVKLSRLLILPYSSLKDVYIDSNVFSLTVFN